MHQSAAETRDKESFLRPQSGDLHQLQMQKEICSKTVICGTGDLPESLKMIKYFQVQLEPKSIKDQQGERVSSLRFHDQHQAWRCWNKEERKQSFFCQGKCRKGRQHVRSLLEVIQSLAKGRLLPKVAGILLILFFCRMHQHSRQARLLTPSNHPASLPATGFPKGSHLASELGSSLEQYGTPYSHPSMLTWVLCISPSFCAIIGALESPAWGLCSAPASWHLLTHPSMADSHQVTST